MSSLEILVPGAEMYDEVEEVFVYTKDVRLKLAHSLISISKWESKWKQPFLSPRQKTMEETMDYIKCMTINGRFDDEVYTRLSPSNIQDVNDYIEAPMTATTINTPKGGGKAPVVTSEVIYYWMLSMNIPFECEKWHINRLLMLVQVCNIKNQPEKKMSRQELLNRNRDINNKRLVKLKTEG